MYYYKIMEMAGFDHVKTLFHGVKGSRKLPIGTWIDAEIKPNCYESKSKRYTSGFHVVESLELCKKYFSLFKNRTGRLIYKCEADGIFEKPGARPGVKLAERMRVVGIAEETE